MATRKPKNAPKSDLENYYLSISENSGLQQARPVNSQLEPTSSSSSLSSSSIAEQDIIDVDDKTYTTLEQVNSRQISSHPFMWKGNLFRYGKLTKIAVITIAVVVLKMFFDRVKGSRSMVSTITKRNTVVSCALIGLLVIVLMKYQKSTKRY